MKYVFSLFLFIFVLVYVSTFYIIQVPTSRSYYVNSFQSMCSVFGSRFDVARLVTVGPFTTHQVDFFPHNCSSEDVPFAYGSSHWEIKQRPIVGDHIHLLYKMKINGKYRIFHDRNITQKIPYEAKNPTCPSAVDYAYEKVFFHTGVHSHCDESASHAGIIHVHPWSSPIRLRSEGRDVTLGLFFESIGVERSTMGKGFLIDGSYRKLNMAYYTNVNNTQESFTTTNEIEILNLWLVDCHGVVLLWDDDSNRPEIEESDREFVKKFKCHPNNYPVR